jgi:hypothetical protein
MLELIEPVVAHRQMGGDGMGWSKLKAKSVYGGEHRATATERDGGKW